MATASEQASSADLADLRRQYIECRRFSDHLASTLSPEDCTVQSMPDVSPTRWHLAHTTWFFETFALVDRGRSVDSVPEYAVLFNSYYNSVGEQFPRPLRGVITRPSLEEILAYRRRVDDQIIELLSGDRAADGPVTDRVASIIELGVQHEQQHQELILTDIKHVLSCNPLHPVYRDDPLAATAERGASPWLRIEPGLYWIGHEGESFAYDNESPRHRVYLEEFEISSSPVTCGEFLEFMADGGYTRPEFWLSEGWSMVQDQEISGPLYWLERSDGWHEFTLAGLQPLHPQRPCSHISYFEADAYARWAGTRLPTEAEWEVATAGHPVRGNFADQLLRQGKAIHPAGPQVAQGDAAAGPLRQVFGDVWEWTASQYLAYPGYRPPTGALGEYNGKFMCNQFVLRGGSCASSQSHLRPTYRNFFPATTRWQFSGFRLARS